MTADTIADSGVVRAYAYGAVGFHLIKDVATTTHIDILDLNLSDFATSVNDCCEEFLHVNLRTVG